MTNQIRFKFLAIGDRFKFLANDDVFEKAGNHSARKVGNVTTFGVSAKEEVLPQPRVPVTNLTRFDMLAIGDRFVLETHPDVVLVKMTQGQHCGVVRREDDGPDAVLGDCISVGNTDMVKKLRPVLRYINVTMINAEGRVLSTQISTTDIQDALDYVSNKVEDVNRGRHRMSSDVDFIEAFVYDNHTKQMRRFDIVTIAGITAINERMK